ncbi:MAG: PAS domain S-box protein [Gemmatimonadetes bacterium]|nr:PAS domain S-box protein [Gemmatimonadota bacterium]
MSVGARSLEALTADLLERLAQVDEVLPACSLVLERLAAEVGADRALALVRVDDSIRGVGLGVADDRVEALMAWARPGDGPFAACLRAAQPLPAPEADEILGFRVVAVPFRGCGDRPLGCAFFELDGIGDRAELLGELLRRCGPAIGRCGQLEASRGRVARVAHQRDLLTAILDTLPDPVLLTGADSTILLANRRAERLFAFSTEDNEGRRRAIQINTLLFGSFLTRAGIGEGEEPAGRELNLVDPTDGSDLVFEVLSCPLPSGTAPAGAVLSILRDITDLKRAVTQLEDQIRRSRIAEHQARRERDQLDAILENVSDPILVTDERSNIILMNPEADRLFVVPPNGGPKGPASRAVQANDTKFTTHISDFLLRNETRRVVKLAITDPDTGKDIPVEIASSKILDARGEPRAIVSIVHDLTQLGENERLARELRQLNAELESRIRRATVDLEERNRRLEWQSQELERAYRLKSEFLASMSHELRTPINVILGYTSLARERIYGDLTAEQEEALSKVYGTSQHLLELINAILDLSRIEAGKMPVHVEVVEVEELVQELSETVRPMLAKKALGYEARVEPGLPPLLTDRTKLKQILLNLLSNAIKFTHDGEIRLEACRGVGEHVRLVVEDTGIGIRDDHLELIFEDFRQVDQSRTREYGGTGLGLSITKKLLTRLGGVISVESEYGKGSRFTVELPLRTEAGSLEDQVRRAAVESDRAVVRP